MRHIDLKLTAAAAYVRSLDAPEPKLRRLPDEPPSPPRRAERSEAAPAERIALTDYTVPVDFEAMGAGIYTRVASGEHEIWALEAAADSDELFLVRKREERQPDYRREAKAPPGEKYERMVKALKKKYSEERAYAIAWDRYNKDEGKDGSGRKAAGRTAAHPNAKKMEQLLDRLNELHPEAYQQIMIPGAGFPFIPDWEDDDWWDSEEGLEKMKIIEEAVADEEHYEKERPGQRERKSDGDREADVVEGGPTPRQREMYVRPDQRDQWDVDEEARMQDEERRKQRRLLRLRQQQAIPGAVQTPSMPPRGAQARGANIFKEGDIVKHTSKFLKSVGWNTNVPKNGKVIGISEGLNFPIVEWSDGREPTPVNPANLMLANKPDYTGSTNERAAQQLDAPGGPNESQTEERIRRLLREYKKRDFAGYEALVTERFPIRGGWDGEEAKALVADLEARISGLAQEPHMTADGGAPTDAPANYVGGRGAQLKPGSEVLAPRRGQLEHAIVLVISPRDTADIEYDDGEVEEEIPLIDLCPTCGQPCQDEGGDVSVGEIKVDEGRIAERRTAAVHGAYREAGLSAPSSHDLHFALAVLDSFHRVAQTPGPASGNAIVDGLIAAMRIDQRAVDAVDGVLANYLTQIPTAQRKQIDTRDPTTIRRLLPAALKIVPRTQLNNLVRQFVPSVDSARVPWYKRWYQPDAWGNEEVRSEVQRGLEVDKLLNPPAPVVPTAPPAASPRRPSIAPLPPGGSLSGPDPAAPQPPVTPPAAPTPSPPPVPPAVPPPTIRQTGPQKRIKVPTGTPLTDPAGNTFILPTAVEGVILERKARLLAEENGPGIAREFRRLVALDRARGRSAASFSTEFHVGSYIQVTKDFAPFYMPSVPLTKGTVLKVQTLWFPDSDEAYGRHFRLPVPNGKRWENARILVALPDGRNSLLTVQEFAANIVYMRPQPGNPYDMTGDPDAPADPTSRVDPSGRAIRGPATTPPDVTVPVAPWAMTAQYRIDGEPGSLEEILAANEGEGGFDADQVAMIRDLAPGAALTFDLGAGGQTTVERARRYKVRELWTSPPEDENSGPQIEKESETIVEDLGAASAAIAEFGDPHPIGHGTYRSNVEESATDVDFVVTYEDGAPLDDEDLKTLAALVLGAPEAAA